MRGNRASSCGEGEVSWVFSNCRRNLGHILKLRWGCSFEMRVSSAKPGLLSSYDGHIRNLNYAWQGNSNAPGCKAGEQAYLSSYHSDIGIPINIQEE